MGIKSHKAYRMPYMQPLGHKKEKGFINMKIIKKDQDTPSSGHKGVLEDSLQTYLYQWGSLTIRRLLTPYKEFTRYYKYSTNSHYNAWNEDIPFFKGLSP